MYETAETNLVTRLQSIKATLGELAYKRREHEISVEAIDAQVAQMESQGVMIEATLKDIQLDKAMAVEAEAKEREDAKEERSKRAKKGAATKEARAKAKA